MVVPERRTAPSREEEVCMRIQRHHSICLTALLVLIFAAGCGDPDKNVAAPTDPVAPPTVTSVTPPTGSTLICPNTAVVTANFSKAMNPSTISTSTFTLSSRAGSVSGQVSYVVDTRIATLILLVDLTAST